MRAFALAVLAGCLCAVYGGEFAARGSFKPPMGTFRPSAGFRSTKGVFTPHAGYKPATNFRAPHGLFRVQDGEFKPPGFKPRGDFRVRPGAFYIGRGFLSTGRGQGPVMK